METKKLEKSAFTKTIVHPTVALQILFLTAAGEVCHQIITWTVSKQVLLGKKRPLIFLYLVCLRQP